jgi:quercetin dioxygenase-like cupin family protein
MSVESRSFDRPDEKRPFPGGAGYVEVVRVGDAEFRRSVHDPGWRWSEHVRTDETPSSCPKTHVGYMLSGRLGVRMDDGSEFEIGPGEAFTIAPGHDAWTVGDEPSVMVAWGDREETR